MNKRIPLILVLLSLFFYSTVSTAVEIVDRPDLDYYVIEDFSQTFSLRDQGITINPHDYNARMIGQPINSWSYLDGKDLVYLGEDSWVLSKNYLTVEPKKIGIIVKDKETSQEYWFITAFLCDDSKIKFERTTDPSCPYGGGDISLILPEAPAGYFPCN